MPKKNLEPDLTFFQFLVRYVFPALFLLLAAFWFGAQKNFIFALAGFLGCFVAAVTLVVEGRKKIKKQ